MTDFHFSVGTALTLQLLRDRDAPRIQAKVLGFKRGESLMVDVAGPAFSPIDLTVGDEVNVRYLVGNSAFGFRCEVVCACTKPYRYFHLSYPQTAEQTRIRQGERVDVAIPATVTNAAGETLSVEIRDISAEGALLAAVENLGNVGETLTLRFALAFAQWTRSLVLPVVIRNLNSEPTDPATEPTRRFGTEFHEIAEKDKLFVLTFVYERMAAARGAVIPATAASKAA